jgi:hypothetical protein
VKDRNESGCDSISDSKMYKMAKLLEEADLENIHRNAKNDMEALENDIPFVIKYLSPELKFKSIDELLEDPEVWVKQAVVCENWYLDMTEFTFESENVFIDSSTEDQTDRKVPKSPKLMKGYTMKVKSEKEESSKSEEKRSLQKTEDLHIDLNPKKVENSTKSRKVIKKTQKIRILKKVKQKPKHKNMESLESITSSSAARKKPIHITKKRNSFKDDNKAYINFVSNLEVDWKSARNGVSLFDINISPNSQHNKHTKLPSIPHKQVRSFSAMKKNNKLMDFKIHHKRKANLEEFKTIEIPKQRNLNISVPRRPPLQPLKGKKKFQKFSYIKKPVG